ncbi:MAG: MarR family transcriptional regulator [Pseudomonadota bacterium]
MSAEKARDDEDAANKRAFVLDQFAPYRIVRLGHAMSGALAQAYREENLTIPEWRVLAVAAQADALAARDVVAKTPMDKMTVSRAIASLEAKGFARRAASAEDRRLQMVSLTQTGRALFNRVATRALAFEKSFLENLNADERALFIELLAKIEESVL